MFQWLSFPYYDNIEWLQDQKPISNVLLCGLHFYWGVYLVYSTKKYLIELYWRFCDICSSDILLNLSYVTQV